MTLTKDGQTMTTEDATVIRAYKLNGWTEVQPKAVERPAKKATPRKASK